MEFDGIHPSSANNRSSTCSIQVFEHTMKRVPDTNTSYAWQFLWVAPSCTVHAGDWKSFFSARTICGVASSQTMYWCTPRWYKRRPGSGVAAVFTSRTRERSPVMKRAHDVLPAPEGPPQNEKSIACPYHKELQQVR